MGIITAWFIIVAAASGVAGLIGTGCGHFEGDSETRRNGLIALTISFICTCIAAFIGMPQ